MLTFSKIDNPYYNGDKEFHCSGEIVVKALDNPYYGSDSHPQPGSKTIQTINNPYYGVELNAEINDSNLHKEDNQKNEKMNKGDVTNVTITTNPYYDLQPQI